MLYLGLAVVKASGVSRTGGSCWREVLSTRLLSRLKLMSDKASWRPVNTGLHTVTGFYTCMYIFTGFGLR